MKSRNPIVASAMKNGAWWEITIPGLEEKLRTPRLGKIEELVRERAAGMWRKGPKVPEIRITYQLPPELATVAREWEAAGLAAERAPVAHTAIKHHRKSAVEELHIAGYTTREIEKVLGISFQHVLRILNA